MRVQECLYVFVVSVMFYPCKFVFLCQWICLFCVSDSVCELFNETIRNMFGCGCYFVVECYK